MSIIYKIHRKLEENYKKFIIAGFLIECLGFYSFAQGISKLYNLQAQEESLPKYTLESRVNDERNKIANGSELLVLGGSILMLGAMQEKR